MFLVPLDARHVIDRFVPLFSVLLGDLWCLLGVCIGTYTGTFTIAGPIIQAFLGDFGLQTAQIANRSAIYSIQPKARNRVNTAFMVFTFCGQLTGTAAGNTLYAKGGWILTGSYEVGSVCAALLFILARGPYEEGWVGWRGGWSILKKSRDTADGKTAEVAMHSRPVPVAENVALSDRERDVEQGVVGPTNIEKAEEMEMAEEGGGPIRRSTDRETEEAKSNSGSSAKEESDEALSTLQPDARSAGTRT